MKNNPFSGEKGIQFPPRTKWTIFLCLSFMCLCLYISKNTTSIHTVELNMDGDPKVVKNVLQPIGINIKTTSCLGKSKIRRYGKSILINGNQSINKVVDIQPEYDQDLNASLDFYYDSKDLGNLDEKDLILYSSTDDGANWSAHPKSIVDLKSNSIHLDGIEHFSLWTAASKYKQVTNENLNAKAFAPPPPPSTNDYQTFPAGSYIINMGVEPQTIGNAVKPYGLIFNLLNDYLVPVNWAIRKGKGKDGVDFNYDGEDYKAGSFIIDAGFRSHEVDSILTLWEGKGVVGVTTTSEVTAPIEMTISYSLEWTLDLENGHIIANYFDHAEIPDYAYNWKDPADIGECEDVFVMPHADPTWAIHSNLLHWNAPLSEGGSGGAIWVNCHAASELENIYNPDDLNETMNFLMKDPAIAGDPVAVHFEAHLDGTTPPPYRYDYHDDVMMQFLGSIDAATQNGSEQIYLPIEGWRPTTKILVWDDSHPEVPSLSPGPAVVFAYGPAFGDVDRGLVFYQGGHDLAEFTNAENIAAMRALLNFSFNTIKDKGLKIESDIPASKVIRSDQSPDLEAIVTGFSGDLTYQWESTCGGSFTNPTDKNTMFIPPNVSTATPCILSCTSYSLNCIDRDVFGSIAITMVPIPTPPTAVDDYSSSYPGLPTFLDALENDFDVNLDPLTFSPVSNMTTSNGVFTNIDNGYLSYISNSGFVGNDSLWYQVCDTTELIEGGPFCDTALIVIAVDYTDEHGCYPDEEFRKLYSGYGDSQTNNGFGGSFFFALGYPDGSNLATLNADPTDQGEIIIDLTDTLFFGDTIWIHARSADGDGSSFDVSTSVDDVNYSTTENLSVSNNSQIYEIIHIVNNPNGARYIKIGCTSTNTSDDLKLDAVKYDKRNCESLCEGSLINFTAYGSAVSASGTATNRAFAENFPNLQGAEITTSQELILDLADTLPITTTIELYLASDLGATPTVHVSGSIDNVNYFGLEDFNPTTDKDESFTQVFYTIANTTGARYIKIESSNATAFLDAIVVDINTCIDNTPVAIDDATSTLEGFHVTYDVLNNDYDIQGEPLTPSIVSSPINGTAEIDGNGNVTYLPNPDFYGTDIIIYEICDPNGFCDQASFVITILDDGCVAEPVTSKVIGTGYGFSATGNATTTNWDQSLGVPDGTFATLNANASPSSELVITLSSTVAIGDTLNYYVSGQDLDAADFTISVSSDGITFVAPQSVSIAGTTMTQLQYVITNSGGAGYVKFVNNDNADNLRLDALEYYQRICIADCPSPTYSVSYRSFAPAYHLISTASAPNNITGQPDQIGAQVNPATFVTVDFGTIIPQGSYVYFYVGHNGTASNITVSGSDNNIIFTNAIAYSPQAVQPVFVQYLYYVNQPAGIQYLRFDGTLARVDVDAVEYLTLGCEDGTPVAQNDSSIICEDNLIAQIPIQINDSDPRGLSLTTSIFSDPNNGQAVVESDGTISYLPNVDYVGNDTIVYQVCNIYGICDQAELIITLVGDACPPGLGSPILGNQSISIATTDDDNIRQDNPNDNRGTCNDMQIKARGGRVGRGLLKFNLTSIPTNAVISSAYLQLYETGGVAEGHNVAVHEMLTDWSEGTQCGNGGDPSWNEHNPGVAWATNGGDYDPAIIDVQSITTANTYYEWDITTLAENWVSGANNYGLMIKYEGSFEGTADKTNRFASKEHGTAAFRPQLIINYYDYNCDGSCGTINGWPPIAVNDTTTTLSNVPVNIDVQANDSDPEGNPLTTSIVSNPANGTLLVEANQSITYDPEGFLGTISFLYAICEDSPTNNSCDTATIFVTTLNVAPIAEDDHFDLVYETQTALSILNDNGNGPDYDPEGQNITLTNIITSPLNGSVTINNNGTSSNPNDDIIIYTPIDDFTGFDTLYYSICDPGILCDTAMVAITVVNQPPVTDDEYVVTYECQYVDVNVLLGDTDPEFGDLTVGSANVTLGMGTVVVNADQSVTFTPAAGFTGAAEVVYSACDDGTPQECTNGTIFITVNSGARPNNPPLANDDEATPIVFGQTEYINVLSNDLDYEGDDIIVNLTDPGLLAPSLGTIALQADQTIAYTSTVGPGIDYFQYWICEDHPSTPAGCPVLTTFCDSATVAIHIPNQNPIAVNDDVTAITNLTTLLYILGNDSEPDNQSITITGVGTDPIPSNGLTVHGGTVTINNNGTPGDPTDDYIAYDSPTDFGGLDTFYYQICDDYTPPLCAQAVVSVEVDNIIIAVDDAFTMSEDDVNVLIDVLVNDYFGPVGPSSSPINLITGTSNGTLVLNDNNTPTNPVDDNFNYTPAPDYYGLDNFEYAICDLNGDCDTAVVTLTIDSVNDLPFALGDAIILIEDDTNVPIDVLANDDFGGDGPEVDSINLIIGTLNGSIVLNDNNTPADPTDDSFTYTPLLDYFGSDSFKYSICDLDNDCDTALVSITIIEQVAIKQLYLTNPGQGLDRIDPVTTADSSTSASETLSTSPGNNTITFFQTDALCTPLTIVANQTIAVSNYIVVTSGTMPPNPNIIVTLNNGATTIATLTNAYYNSATGMITWSGIIPADVTVPAGFIMSLEITTAEADVEFYIEYDSNNKPSKIDLPVNTFIDITDLVIYNKPYPDGKIITSYPMDSTVYIRSVVSDPFGYADITGLNMTISPPGSTNPTIVVDSTTCTRIYEYAWTIPAAAIPYNITGEAKEGFENTVTDIKSTTFTPCLEGACGPIANDDVVALIQGSVVFIPVLENDIDPDNNLDTASLAIISQSSYGTVILGADGEVGYISSASYLGPDQFTYQICDETTPTALCDTAIIFITTEADFIDPCAQAVREHTFYLPYPVEYLYAALRNAANCPANLGNTLRSVTSIKTPYPGLVMIYDHWEDGYETDINNPLQLTTQVWGDGNPGNGAPPGYPTDVIPAGGSIVLDNSMIYNPRNPADIYFDGKDKIFSSNDIAISIVAGDIAVFDFQTVKTIVNHVDMFGTLFTVPFGEDLGDEFQYTSLFIRAEKNGTNLQLDKDNNGTYETNTILNEGEVLFVDGGILSGATLIASQPVGVDVLFGGLDCFGTRQVNILPGQYWGNSYYSPVPTTLASAPAAVYTYNHQSTPITIDWVNNTNSGSFVVPANTTIKYTLALINSGYRFSSSGGEKFLMMEVIDSDANGSGYDWSFSLVSEERVSDFVNIAWAPGSSNGTANYHPIWVTPNAATTLYIKYDGNLADNTALLSPCDIYYDVSVPLSYLDSYLLYDNSDNDQSGIAIYTCDGTKITAVWGEDPNAGGPTPTGSPAMDVGTAMQPMCRSLMVLATDDNAVSPLNGDIVIPVISNDHGFNVTVNPTSISTAGLLQPSNGNITINPNGTINYQPNTDYEGFDEFEYIICSNESATLCDYATVRINVTDCAAKPNENLVQGFVYLENRPDDGAYTDENFLPGIQVKLYGDTNCDGILDANELLIETVNSDASGSFAYQFSTTNGEYVKDDFENSPTINSGNDGSVAWSTNWTEVGQTNGFSNSPVTINLDAADGDSSLIINGANSGVSRNVTFSNAGSAALSFNYRRQNLANVGEVLDVQIINGNGTFTLMSINDGNGVGTDNFYIPVSINIPLATIDPDGINTIRFRTNGSVASTGFYFVDNVKLIYHTPEVCFITQVDASNTNGAYSLGILNEQSTSFFGTDGLGNCSGNLYLGVLPNFLAIDDNSLTNIDVPVIIDILQNDIGVPDITTIDTTGLQQPTTGTITLNPEGTITYQPGFAFQGTDWFEYQVCSAEESILCDTARVDITVSCLTTPGQDVISGTVFTDLNGNTLFDNGESGQGGAKVRLYEDENQDGLVDAGDTQLDSILTNADGSYSFSHIIWTPTENVTLNVTAGTDDAEENIGNGNVSTNSPDLEIGNDAGVDQLVGIRFNGVDIPPGAVIQNAYLEFYADGDHSGATNLTIYGEDADDAAAFSTTNSDLSNRSRTGITVDWSNVPAWTDNNTYTTPAISSVVQSIVDRTGWSSGNNMVFLIDGTGRRRAETFEGGGGPVPKLVIDYVTGVFPAHYVLDIDRPTLPGTLTTDNVETASFTNTNQSDCLNNFGFQPCENGCPPEANDDAATTEIGLAVIVDVLFNDYDPNGDLDTASVSVPAGVTQPVNGTTVVNPATGAITYTPFPTFGGVDFFEYQVCDQSSPTIKCDTALVTISVECPTISGQNLISGYVYDDLDGNAVFDYGESGQSNIKVRIFQDVNQDGLVDAGDNPLDSMLTDGDGIYSFSPIVLNPTQTVTVDVSAGTDDAEESKGSGNVSTNSNDLEMGNDRGTNQWVGIRFSGISVPAGAFIQNAYIEFYAKGNNSSNTNLTIYGEDTDNAIAFSTANNDISSRSRTANTVDWSNVPAWVDNNTYTTPVLSSIVQSIVDRNGWISGNDMVFMIEGSGRRRAESFNGTGGPEPRLVIDYATAVLPAHFVMEIEESNLPVGTKLTTDNIEVTVFPSLGEDDCINNFGFQTCPGGCPPDANDDTAITDEGVNVVIEALANDTDLDLDLDPATVSVPVGGVQPANGSTGVNLTNGEITYTPDPLFVGIDSFEYQVCDQSSPIIKCDTAMVRVTVICPSTPGTDIIRGHVFDDTDGNAIFNVGESGQGGAKIRLYEDVNQNGSVDVGDIQLDSILTNGDGSYSFSHVIWTPTENVTLNVGAGTDDAEENKGNGNVSTNDPDLEMGDDDGTDQWVGIRFNAVNIPQDAVIQNAYIEFYADGDHPSATNLTIYGEDTDDAVAFSTTNSDLSNRSRTGTTTDWSNVPAWSDNNTYTTPAISSVVQSIVDRTGWSSGNSMVFLIEGTGRRRAESFDGGGGPAPQLVIDYVTGVFPAHYVLEMDRSTLPGTVLTTDNVETASFTDTNQSDCLNNFGFQPCGSDCAPEANDDAATTEIGLAIVVDVLFNDYDSNGDLDTSSVSVPPGVIQPTNGTTSINPATGEITYTPFPTFGGIDVFEYQVCDQSSPTPLCDTALVTISVVCPTIPGQNLISGHVYDDLDGNNIFDYGESGQSNIKVRIFQDVNQDGLVDADDNPLDSMLTDGDGIYSFSPIVLNPTQTVTVDVSAGTDDAEESKGSGNVSTNSNDLEMGNDRGTNQWVGIRFSGISVPAGAFIQNAYIEFYAKGNNSSNTNLTIYGEDIDNAIAFSTANNDLSSRTKTANPVDWSNVTSWVDNNTYTTPVLSSIVQSIVDRAGWVSGNDMVFMIEGSGRRRAESFNGTGGPEPRLVIDYATAVLPAHFVMEVEETTLPVGTMLTTDNIEVTVFPSLGEDDCINNFGYQACPGGCPPDAIDDEAITDEGVDVVIDVLVNDTDLNLDLDPSTVSIPAGGVQPANGSTNINFTNGEITYTPDPIFIGVDSFEYQVCDQSSPVIKCDTAMVRITVNCPVTPGQNIIRGYVFDDLDGNTIFNNGENGGVNVKVRLYDDVNEDGLLDAGDIAIDSMLSNGDGSYSFSTEVLDPPQNLSIKISAGADDAEETINTGTVITNSENLDMGNQGGFLQWVGMRFPAINIPPGAIIQNAYIEFEAARDDAGATDLTIYGEDTDDAAAFTTANSNISNRDRTSTTTDWSNVPSWTEDNKYDSPSITSIVQAIVDREGWATGNDMVIMLEGIGKRRAKAQENTGNTAPRLVIDFSVGLPAYYLMETDESTLPIGTMLTTDNIETTVFTDIGQVDCLNSFGYQSCPGGCPPEANDDEAITIEGTAVVVDVLANDTDLDLDLDPSTVSVPIGGVQPANGSTNINPTTGAITYSPDPIFIGIDSFEYLVCDLSSPVIKCDTAMVRITVTCPVIPGQNIIRGYVFDDLDGDTIFNNGESGGGNVKVRLYDDVNEDGALDAGDIAIDSMLSNGDGTYSFTPDALGPTQNLSIKITAGSDDAEEVILTGIAITISDKLDMGNQGGFLQMVGMRFPAINLPSGAIIQNAYIEFEASNNDSEATNLTIYGEDIDDAPTFSTLNSILSSRTKTSTSVDWNNIPAWSAGDKYDSPSIATIVQTIIDRGGWASGNDMVFMIEGTGKRRAKAQENAGNTAPRLVIEFVVGLPAYYIMETDQSTLPVGTMLTTDNIEATLFTAVGQSDCLNNFGYQTCPGGCAPIANDDIAVTEIDVAVLINVPANDTDLDLDLDLTSVSIPAGLIQPTSGTTAIDPATGAITYTPDNGFTGLDSFEYVICDLSTPSPKCDTALVNVEVLDCNVGADEVKLTGQLFVDKNANTFNDDDGSGVQGVTVYLFVDFDCSETINEVDSVIQTTSTNALGMYSFIDTVGVTGFPYCYITVVEAATLPLGYSLTTGAENTASFSAPSTCVKNLDVGAEVFISANDDAASMLTYSGYIDLNVLSNDIGNPSAPLILSQPTSGIASVNGDETVRFIPDDDSIVSTYIFTYQICSLDDPTVCDIAEVNVKVLDCTAGPTEKILRGKVFQDDNDNGVFDIEGGIENIIVEIYEDVNQNKKVDVSDVLLSTEITNASGGYVYNFVPTLIQAQAQFNATIPTYSGGSGPWTTDWLENDPDGNAGPIGNYVGIVGGELFFHWAYQNAESIQRSVDLTGTATATLSFDWRTVGLDAGESLSVQVSSDGTNFTTIGSFTGNQTGTFSQDISTYISGNTTTRFINENLNWENGEYTYLDNIEITAEEDVTHFVIQTDTLSYPITYYLTTDNIETAIILTTGECDSPNDFGLHFPDNDADGIADIVDLDDDNDGIPDLLESPSDPLADIDADMVPAYLDDDDSNGGVGDVNGIVEAPFDLDNDGIANHFDLDADNDGCSDALEAGHNQSVQVDNTIAGPFGLNGLANGVESNDSQLASINYTLSETTSGTYDFLNSSLSSGCNEAPFAIPDINATETNNPVSGNVLTNDQDPDNDNLIVNTLPINPFGGTVVIDAIGNYVFTPTSGFSGEAGFYYQVCDDYPVSLCDTAIVNIDVIDISDLSNNQIIGTPDHFVTENDNILSADLLENDSDPEGDSLFISTTPVNLPTSGALIIHADGTFSYTPFGGFIGVDYYRYEVCNTGAIPLCDTVNVSIEVLRGNGLNDLYATDDANLGNIGDTLSGNVILNDNDPSAGILTVNTTPIFAPQNGTLTLNSTGNYSFISDPGFAGNDRFVYQVCDSGSPTACDSATVYLTIIDNRIVLDLKVLLQGALFGSTDSLMRADLVAQNLVPLEQPYSTSFSPLFGNRFVHTTGGAEITTDSILNANSGTSDGIVDWVFVELRSPTDSVTVIRTISALVQRDGDVVDAQNGGPLYVTNLFGRFFVIIKHRNHLGAMTAAPVTITNKVAKADFTTMTDSNLYHDGIYDGLEQTLLYGKNALWAGNANADDKTKYDGTFNDRIILAAEIITAPNNIDQVLNYNDAIGYFQGDINMDGKAKYDGFLNDRILLQYIILTYPNNTGLLNNYDQLVEQVK